jgi:hypothetical protein
MAYKLWTTNEVLTAADLNAYLMRQSMIKCTSGTRPASPDAGMMVYETDTRAVRVYDGSGWRRTGAFDQETLGAGAATDSTTISGITSTSFVPGSPVNGFSFVAPPSGGIYVNVSGRITMTTNTNEMLLSFEIRSGGSVGAGTMQVSGSSVRALTCGRAVNSGAVAVICATRRVRISPGTLTPGSTFNIQNLHMVSPGGTGTVEYRELTVEPVL